MHKMLEWIFAGFFILWSLAPAGLVAFAWRRWVQARGQLNAEGKPIDNRPFLIGQILGTVSCCALLFFPSSQRNMGSGACIWRDR